MENRQSRLSALWNWLDQRIGLAPVVALARKKEVPIHKHSIWYYMGGMTLFLFMVQIGTGVLLLIYYRPSAEEAYESVQFLMTDVKFGWLVRSIHHWDANLMIFMAFIHLFSVLFMKAYRPPRELTWYSGVILLVLSLGFGFTGYLLPWNELAYFATRVGTEIVGVFPLVGDFALKVARGGTDVTGATLTRFYALHVAILPATAILLVGLHLLLVQKLGMSTPLSVENSGSPKKAMKFIPNFALRDAILARRVPASPPGSKSRSIRPRTSGDQTRMVFHVHVSPAQAPSRAHPGHRGRACRRHGVCARRSLPVSGSSARSKGRKRTTKPTLHVDWDRGARLHRGHDVPRLYGEPDGLTHLQTEPGG